MAETSRSRVTITLGSSGQVVKKAGQVVKKAGATVDDRSFSVSQPSIGRKRSIRDRLGSNVDSTAQFSGKRQQREDSRLSLNSTNDMDDVSLTKDDLRFKIMRKNNLNKNQRYNQQNVMDLRDVLSRPAQSSTPSVGTGQREPELKDTRQQLLEPRAVRQQIPEPRNVRQLMPEPRNVRQQMPEPRNVRQLMTEPRDSWHHLPEPRDGRHLMPEVKHGRHHRPRSNGSSILSQIPSTRSTDDLPHTDSLRNPYSPWTLDSLRRRSPDKFLRSSRDFSPPRRDEEQERRPLLRAYDDSRTTSYMSKDAVEHPHPMKSATYNIKTAHTAGPARSMPSRLPSLPASVGPVQKTSYTAGDHSMVDSFLHSLGLDKYIINFKAEEVDMYALRQMGDNDLKDLGIPMGPRKKILLTLLSRSKRQS